jgi:ankyrin repeat protein
MKQLPASPDISHLKKQAKELLHLYRQGDLDALQRFLANLPSAQNAMPESLAARELHLHDAQSCLSREYGFRSWAELKTYVDWKSSGKQDGESVRRRWVSLVYGEGYGDPRPRLAIQLLREWPNLTEGYPYLSCAIGDEAALRKALEVDAGLLMRPGGPLNMTPLIAVTHSGMVRDASYADALMNCAKLLLDRGADPNQTWINPKFPESQLSALYGAAGRNHHVGMTKLLLDRGASPDDNESLYHSVESSDLSCTRLLLEAGAKVDGTNAVGRVLDYNRLDGLRMLLNQGGNVEGNTGCGLPIFHAIRRGRSVEHVRMLLEAGADPVAVNSEGMTPYRFARFFGKPEIAAMLPRVGEDAEASKEERFVAACACCEREATRRQLADDPGILQRLTEKQLRQLPNMAAHQNLAAVKLMLEVGWPIAASGGEWGASALNLAVYRGQEEMTEFLLQHGASWTEKHAFGDNVMGTLSYASRAENIETDSGDWLACAKSLIAHGMPLPPERYEFSEEVTEYFESLRDDARAG